MCHKCDDVNHIHDALLAAGQSLRHLVWLI